MEILSLSYRDPLFGIILFLVLVLVVFFSNKIWNNYSNSKKERSIARFMKKFDYTKLDEELKILFSKGIEPQEPLKIVASIYQKSGEHEKAIKIYLALLETIEHTAKKTEIMELLGKSYFEAGFMQRSKEIFLEVLKNYPRNPLALKYLMFIYESLQDYDRAVEILEPLEVLGEDVAKEGKYFRIKKRIKSEPLFAGNLAQIFSLADDDLGLRRVIFAELLANGLEKELAANLQKEDEHEIIDILWKLKETKLLAKAHNELSLTDEILAAKGIGEIGRFHSFELSAINAINKYSDKKASLDFEYLCKECKHIYPLSFERCPNCMTLLRIEPLPLISKSRDNEENNSFL